MNSLVDHWAIEKLRCGCWDLLRSSINVPWVHLLNRRIASSCSCIACHKKLPTHHDPKRKRGGSHIRASHYVELPFDCCKCSHMGLNLSNPFELNFERESEKEPAPPPFQGSQKKQLFLPWPPLCPSSGSPEEKKRTRPLRARRPAPHRPQQCPAPR